ncbi:MAG: hypothetical protein ACODAD_11180 [Planctomycetota bacterium]
MYHLHSIQSSDAKFTGIHMLRFSAVFILLATLFCPPLAHASEPPQPSVLEDKHPRVFFFRSAEGAWNTNRYPTYESWEVQFDRLQGIMGKCLEEECLNREPRNAEFFTRFKQRHPEQAVLLHFNGNARDPRYHTEAYFPGHWVYRSAVMITEDVPAVDGESTIKVSDASGFRVNAGRYRTSNDDIALFGMTADKEHDWYHCEQVKLVSVNPSANTIKVERGCYGTEPLEFKAKRSRAAAHQVEGPWGRRNHIMWYYNFSALCPKDENGKTCSDLLIEDLARWFGEGGQLAAFDGLEFDVMFNQTHGDTDGDGRQDNGMLDGVNQYGIGVVEFARTLRRRMGDDFIIQADGALGTGGSRSQRATGILNGIESEGWPNLRDWEFDDWSGGMNRHFFWRANAHQPDFSYVNHKWIEPVPGEPGTHKHPDVPFARHRLVFAACQFFDAAICYSFAPPRDPDGKFGVWDEFRRGAENQLRWLGRPEAPAVRLATRTPDLLADKGTKEMLAERISGPVRTSVTADGVRVEPLDAAASNLKFTLPNVPANGRDLYLEVVMQGEPRAEYPLEMSRFAQVGVSGGMIDLMAGQPTVTGMKLRGATREVELDNATGARIHRRVTTIGETEFPAFFVHPPYRGCKGYTFWQREVEVPSESELRFSVGMGEKSPERSDGVRFEVHAAVVKNGTPDRYAKLFEVTTKQHKWLPQSISLSQYAGQRVRLKFVADCGPHDNATTDHGHWGAVRIVETDTDQADVTKFQDFMTWVNDKPFRSGFYYQHVQSDGVNVSFRVEGSEPVVIHSIAAYAHPDTVYRTFEHGIVLANPSRKPYEFDLTQLSPGRQYRRFQGTANQDTQTNNGRPVGTHVTLDERDGLFLKRIDAP